MDLTGRGAGSLESRSLTVCSGLDLVNITYNNFVAADEKTAKVGHARFLQNLPELLRCPTMVRWISSV